MFSWFKGRTKEPGVEDYLKLLERSKKKAKVEKVLLEIGQLAVKDEDACSQLCQSRLVQLLEGCSNELCLEICNLLSSLAKHAGDVSKWHLGTSSGAVKYLVTCIKINNSSSEDYEDVHGQCVASASVALATLCSERRNKRTARSLGVLKSLLDIFQQQMLPPDKMKCILKVLEAVIDLDTDSAIDVSVCIPKLLYHLTDYVHGNDPKTDEDQERVALVCCFLCFLSKSQELLKTIVLRGGLCALADLIPETIKSATPIHLASVLKCVAEIHDSSMPRQTPNLPPGTVEKLQTLLGESIERSNELSSEGVGNAVRTMNVAWRVGDTYCTVAGERVKDQRGLRLLFELMRSDFSKHILRHKLASRDEMLKMKERLMTAVEQMTKDVRNHEAIKSCGGLQALHFVMKSIVQEHIKGIASTAIRNLEESENPGLRCSENPLYEQPRAESGGIAQQINHQNPFLLGSVAGHVGQKRKSSSGWGDGGGAAGSSRKRMFRQGPLFS